MKFPKIKPLYLVAAVFFLFLWGLAHEANAETSVTVGPLYASGEATDGGVLMLNESFGKYTFSLAYFSEQTIVTREPTTRRFPARPNAMIAFRRDVNVWRNLNVGIGAAYILNTSRAIGRNENFHLYLGWRFTNWSIEAQHQSNAGTGTPNQGQDAITISYYFGDK